MNVISAGLGALLFLGPGLGEAQAASLRLPSASEASAVVNCAAAPSVARAWNEQALAAIRIDAPRPTVHARNLYHLSVALYDTWAAFDALAQPVLADESAAAALAGPALLEAALSHSAYRLLVDRFRLSPGAATTLPRLRQCMVELGLDPDDTSTSGNSAAAIGHRVADALIAHGLQDGSNQAGSYVDPTPFFPVNNPMLVVLPGTGALADINAWQPLIPPGAPGVQSFLTSHWADVTPFALVRPGPNLPYIDPGSPPRLGGAGDAALRADVLELIALSAQLDPADPTVIDRSPAVFGNNPLGSNAGIGHPLNPVTGQPYAPNPVIRGDYGRVLAEFWADGPQSSTPPGHWNEIANEVSDHPLLSRRIRGRGPEVSQLEWDVKLYLALNGALHDNAIATWEIKHRYANSRPITLIRGMAGLGQASDPALPRYHPNGLPLVPGLIELVTTQSSAPGQRHAHLAAFIGQVAIRAWAGHPANQATQAGGVAWILGERWIPYQQRNFVTPPFPGYTSGHSGFSRAAAEVLASFTGSDYFPGGLGEALAATGGQGFALGFEFGPSVPMHLQWGTYFDAADEAGLSRLYGGIHPTFDDLPGRVLGHQVGLAALERAYGLYGSLPDARPVPGPGRYALLSLVLMFVAIGVLALPRGIARP